jgi:hypothetical protein
MPKEEKFNFSPDYFSDVFILALWRPWTLLAYSTNGNYDVSKPPKTLVLSYKRPEGAPYLAFFWRDVGDADVHP